MNKFKKGIYNLAREQVKKQLTRNLGKVIEEDDRLICYVNKHKCEKNIFTNTFACSGITDNDRRLAEVYNLVKPIYYVFDGLVFDKNQVYIYGYDNANIIIRNCQFFYGLYVTVHGKCFLSENSYIRAFRRLSIYADDITIKDMNIINELKYTSNLNVEIAADDNLNIINSYIGKMNEKSNIDISAGKKIIIDNSQIEGDNIKCESPKIETHHDSSLIATKRVNLNVKDFEPIKITSPVVALNNNEINSNNKPIKLKQLTNPLSIKRLELINLLKQVKVKCDKVNSNEINEYKSYINNRPISKTLKK